MYLCSKPEKILVDHWAVLTDGAQPPRVWMCCGSAFAGEEPHTLVPFA